MSPYPANISKLNLLKEYWEIPASIIFIIISFAFHNPLIATFASWIAISLIAILVSEVAESISDKIPQPYDSLILTMAAVWVEILLLFMLLKNWVDAQAAEVAKNSIVSAVLVDINVLFWLSLFIWWLVWKEQKHNEDSSESYTLILLATVFVIIIPTLLKIMWVPSHNIVTASVLISSVLFVFYVVMLIFQTKTHVHFFKEISKKKVLKKKIFDEDDLWIFDVLPMWVNVVSMISLLWLVWILAERFSHEWMYLVNDFNIPLGLAWVVVALISVFPELFTVVKAAKANEPQKVVNIALWASVVTILITVPFLMMLSLINGVSFDLTLHPFQIIALVFTILLVWRVTNNWETDYLKWISHIVLFVSYLIMISFS